MLPIQAQHASKSKVSAIWTSLSACRAIRFLHGVEFSSTQYRDKRMLALQEVTVAFLDRLTARFRLRFHAFDRAGPASAGSSGFLPFRQSRTYSPVW